MPSVHYDLPLHWKPRSYQIEAWEAARQGCRHMMLILHRKAGKDYLVLNIAAFRAMMVRAGLYWHITPTNVEGKSIIWDNRDNFGRPYTACFPDGLVTGRQSNIMQLTVQTAMQDEETGDPLTSVFQVKGADYPDRLRGPNPCHVNYSEAAFMKSESRDVIDAVLPTNKGTETFATTPNGKNWLYNLREKTLDNVFDPVHNPDGWFHQILTVEDTCDEKGNPIVTQEEIEQKRREGKSEQWIQREYYCSFDTPVEGAYYGDDMMELEESNRITDVPWLPELPVFVSADIGHRDSTSLTFFQMVGENIHFIDYYENSRKKAAHYAANLKSRDFVYGGFFGPHDLKNENLANSAWREFYNHGIKFDVVPKIGLNDGIEAVRSLLPRCKFDRLKCKRLIQAMREYRYEIDDSKEIASEKPVRDWTTHPADSVRYGAIAIKTRKLFNKAQSWGRKSGNRQKKATYNYSFMGMRS